MSELTEAIAGVLGWHFDDTNMPSTVREEHNKVIAAARKYADLTSPETIDKVAKELKRAALDNLGWSDQARAVLRAVTEDTQ